MKRFKIRYRLSLFIIAGVLSTTLLGIIFVYRTQGLYEEMIYQQTAEKYLLYSQRMEEKMKEADQLSLLVMADGEVQRALANIAQSHTTFNSYEYAKLLARKLAAYELSGHTVPSIFISDQHQVIHSGGPLLEAVHPAQLKEYEEYAAPYKGASVWTGSEETGKLFVSLREIRQIEQLSLKRLGMVGIQVPAEKIVHEAYNGMYRGSSALIIQAQGQTVYSDFTYDPLPVPKQPSAKGYDVITIEGEKYLVASFTLSYSGWTFIHLLPYGGIFERLREIKITLILIYGAVCGLLLCLGWKFSGSITRPLEVLTAKMAQVAKGNFVVDKTAKPENHDEIWLLDRSLDRMTIRLNELINENYVKQMKLKEAEYDMLKAKLNPHFLYNTLDSINWLARINGQAAISDMIKALGDLLRASINSKEMNTLGEELDIIRKYIAIQQFRFEERLVCQIEVDERWLELPVPSMILQPVVENCIKYGVDARTGICRIHIGVEQRDQELIVTIKDHGSGVTDPAAASSPAGGFGLTSINERLWLLYGEAFGVKLLEDKDGGTTVQLTVPVPV